MTPEHRAHAERQMAAIERDLHSMGRARRARDGWQPLTRPAAPDGRRLAAASAGTAIVSVLVWPLGFVALWLAWKATRRGMELDWPEAAWAIGGATLGMMTAALTSGLVGALIATAVR